MNGSGTNPGLGTDNPVLDPDQHLRQVRSTVGWIESLRWTLPVRLCGICGTMHFSHNFNLSCIDVSWDYPFKKNGEYNFIYKLWDCMYLPLWIKYEFFRVNVKRSFG